ncbi:hypothetical protein [Gracilibacillus kekensis]|uniref:hypothetical protein n=1 Tax=Gracilibacillus kekensis TaxID=1027249 RepID=UPI001FCD6230|nr:hypothetical protein [Gracilibacillus kekensis]
MPCNKEESIIFGVFMCIGMVTVVSFYNLVLQGFSTFTVVSAILQFVVTLFIAFIAESFVEPAARKLALSLPYHKTKERTLLLRLPFVWFQ